MPAKPQKTAHIKDAVLAAAGKQGAARDKKLARDFTGAFYHRTPDEDLAGWTPEMLAGIAAGVLEWAFFRKPGEHKVRVFNPGADTDHSVRPTVIEIVADDMAFLVDSVSADLAFRGFNIDALFHPILNISRNAQGRILSVAAGKRADKGHGLESCMYIRLEQVLPEGACRKLADKLRAVLDEVRAATSDWQEMLQRMDKVIDSLHGKDDDPDFTEGRELLSYLRANNFTFLGCRAVRFDGQAAKTVKGSELGVLRNDPAIALSPGGAAEIRALDRTPGPVMVTKLISKYSAVHRRVPMDAISVKITDRDGKLTGMHLFVGLFTSSTYSCRTAEVPLVRSKVREVISRAGFRPGSHDYNALWHILEKMPRDELFQVTVPELYTLALGILRLQEKHAVALFTHMDPLGQYMSCLVYVPRDRYNTQFRVQAGKILESALSGRQVNYFTTLDDSPLARLLLNIRLDGKHDFDRAAAEQKLVELGREWPERLKHVLIGAHGRAKGADLASVYGRGFTTAYHESIDIRNAAHDIRQLELLHRNHEAIRIDLYRLTDAPAGDLRLKVYHRNAPVALCDILPVLENMGLRGLSETPFEVRPDGRDRVWLHDFRLAGPEDIAIEAVKAKFEEAFLRVWRGQNESDGLNQLVLRAGLDWSEVRILRAYSAFMRQARFPYSRSYIEQALNAWPQAAAKIVELFRALHDPKKVKAAAAAHVAGEIDVLLQQVDRLDHDRILRGFRTLVEKTLRTNYFQRAADGQPKEALAFKLDSKNIEALPLPRPHVEIFVFSVRVEAVHLRGGEIARGGIRWSDRNDDYRTEVLSLMKAQMVKNTVIVPVGAKGGFILKQPPKTGGPDALRQEAISCYKVFVQALLDLTDNNVRGKIVRPKGVVCHDGPDTYLVVAADKGTAKFSDIANELSLKAGFWLGDAFASGGSTGYDHKEIAITSRGGWESVKRHFRELGKDIQKEPFTTIGVGDMSGDVFGNGVLLSKQMKLTGAFNHLHIFCDPDPDAAVSFAERARLFKAQAGWDAYDKAKLSPGGAVFERSAKTIKLSPQIKKCFGIDQASVTPDDLIRAILKSDAELLWLGGIGTFVKSAKQSHADADDKANDAVRIDGEEIRAKVVGEGANLGFTQLGRVEYARAGGRINTDFIDNSGGVDCSDHEVNIKILLSDVTAEKKLSMPERNKLLERMTDDVAALVLADNYQQTQSLSLQETMAREHLGLHVKLIRALEKQNLIRRGLEGLPDEDTLARLARDGQALTRPDLCVLMSWAKIALFNDVMASDLPGDPAFAHLLSGYFPAALQQYGREIASHKLRRGIVATQAVNAVVNRMGPVFVPSRMEKTGAPPEKVVQAFMMVMGAFGLEEIWRSVESLDNKVPCAVQTAALAEIYKVCKRAVTWLLRFGPDKLDTAREIAALKPGITLLKKSVTRTLPPGAAAALKDSAARLAARGVPQQLAADISVMKLLSSACDIIHVARKTKRDIDVVAEAYFRLGDLLHLDWLKSEIAALAAANGWQARVIGSVMDDYYHHQAALTAAVMKGAGKGKDPVAAWLTRHEGIVARFAQTVTEMRAQPKPQLEMFVLAGQRLSAIVGGLE